MPGDTVFARDDVSLDSGFSDDEREAVSEGIHSINQKLFYRVGEGGYSQTSI